MDKIGIRAVREVYSRVDSDHHVKDICAEIELNDCSLYQWRKGRIVPSAPVLRRMALAGYDIHYILTGERK